MLESLAPLPIYGWRNNYEKPRRMGKLPKYLICDNDSKFGPSFARVATTSAIEILKTPPHAPRANAICERFLRSVRQECLDHLLIFREKQLQRVLNVYGDYFYWARPHQGIQQQVPEPRGPSCSSQQAGDKVTAVPILAGLHHDYQRKEQPDWLKTCLTVQ